MNDELDTTLDTETGIDDSVLAEEAQGETIKKLKQKLKDAESKTKENLDGWQRAQADFLNLRKRDEEAKLEFLKFSKADLILEIIPVLDSFTQAMSHGQKEAEPIYNQLIQILKASGLEESNPVGETFDPKKHEAISMVSVETKENDHKVIEVLQKGYTLSDKVLRPAKVRVGEYTE